MGRVSTTFELTNYRDVVLAWQGLLAQENVRRVSVEAVIDSRTMHLVLPKSLVDLLGLPLYELPAVRRGARCEMVKDARVELFGRSGVFNAIVEPNRTDALIGAIVMEDLDLIVDCGKNEVVPRDPTTITSEIE
jgi:hypothetical protein